MTANTTTVLCSAPAPRSGVGERKDYHALNAQLNLFAADGSIQFEKAQEAAAAYLAHQVLPHSRTFETVWDRLHWFVTNEYYESDFLSGYDATFVDSLHAQAEAHGHEFQTFLGAFKFYTPFAHSTAQLFLNRLPNESSQQHCSSARAMLHLPSDSPSKC